MSGLSSGEVVPLQCCVPDRVMPCRRPRHAAAYSWRVTRNRARARDRFRAVLALFILLGLLNTAASAQNAEPKIDILQVSGALDHTCLLYTSPSPRD